MLFGPYVNSFDDEVTPLVFRRELGAIFDRMASEYRIRVHDSFSYTGVEAMLCDDVIARARIASPLSIETYVAEPFVSLFRDAGYALPSLGVSMENETRDDDTGEEPRSVI